MKGVKFARRALDSKKTLLILYLLTMLLVAACAGPNPTDTESTVDSTSKEHGREEHLSDAAGVQQEKLLELEPAKLDDGELLQVVASTSIVADVVAQVGGDRIDLTGLIPVGADAHSFEATPRDLIALNDADAIFINGLGLEAALDPILDSLDPSIPVIAVNTGVDTIVFSHEDSDQHGAEEGDAHAGPDPHTWFSIHLVEQWVANVAQVLSALDSANANFFDSNAQAYLAELEALEDELDKIVTDLPVEKRILVTDHEVFGYFAAEYDFDIIGTVIPSLSTAASPSAGELAGLQDQIEASGVNAIFVGVSANSDLMKQIASDTGTEVVPVYTESLSESGGTAASYIELMRHNMRTIVDALN